MTAVLLTFEIAGSAIYLLALIFCIRERNPFFLGIFLSCNMLVFWDWIFNQSWFFNVTFHEDLMALWEIRGEKETLAAALAFVGFYYWVFHLLTKYSSTLDHRLGGWQYPVLYLISVGYVLAFEGIFVNLGVWTYYQEDVYELFGVAWSNGFFNAHILLICYVLLKHFHRWAGMNPARSGFAPYDESFWRPLTLATSAIQTGFFLAFVLQMFWYIQTQPWVDSPRLF